MNIPALICQARFALAAEFRLDPEHVACGTAHEFCHARRMLAWVIWKLTLCRCREFAEATGSGLSYLTDATAQIDAELMRDPDLKRRLQALVERLRALTGVRSSEVGRAKPEAGSRFAFAPYRNTATA